MLSAPLPSTASAGSIVYTSALSGNPLHLVVTYEYVPGVGAVDSMAYRRPCQPLGERPSARGPDGLPPGRARIPPDAAGHGRHGARGGRHPGQGRSRPFQRRQRHHQHRVGDGGYGFNAINGAGAADAKATTAWRPRWIWPRSPTTTRVRSAPMSRTGKKGYSAPGQIAYNGEAIRQMGLKAQLPLTDRTTLQAKADDREATTKAPTTPSWACVISWVRNGPSPPACAMTSAI